MKRLVKNVRREFLIFWGIPKNIYMPISIFSIIFVIFTIIDSNQVTMISLAVLDIDCVQIKMVLEQVVTESMKIIKNLI